MDTPRRPLLVFAYLALYLGWGTTYLAIRVGVRALGPASFLGLRFLLAALALLPLLLAKGGAKGGLKGLTRRQVTHSALQGLLLLVGGLLPVAYAEKRLPSNITAIVIGCAPIAFAVFDRALNGTPIRRATLMGFAFGFLGLLLLGGGGEGAFSALGLGLVIVGCLTWAFASVLSKKLDPAPSPLAHVFIQYVAVSLPLLLGAVLLEGLRPAQLAACGADTWESLIYISLVPSLLSYTAYMWLLRHESSSRVSTYAFVNPVVAVLAGALLLHERATPAVLGALALVLLGTAFTFAGRRAPAPAEESDALA